MINLISKKIYYILFSLFFLFFRINYLHAQETHQIEYISEYFVEKSGDCLVNITAKITHLRSDVAVKELTYKFPKNFAIEIIKAQDFSGEASTSKEEVDNYIKLKILLSHPPVGKNTENEVVLSFKQKNLIKFNGHIWEVILPVIKDQKSTKNKIIFHLPQDSEKSLSLSKPKPNLIKDRTIYWENINEKTIYAVFGNFQIYTVVLSYHLENQNLFPVIREVTFPPETLYQSVFINNIEPKPVKTYLDVDDNFIAQYQLGPKEKKTISFEGYLKTMVQPQKELIGYFKKKFELNKNFYLSPQPYWELSQSILENQLINPLKKPNEIYQFVTNFLQYDFNKLKNNPQRLGAKNALLNPKNVVCLEFTDTFVAIAREKGIPAREINGYGYSEEQEFRPISLTSDILHSWPEYFDENRGIWVPVDPTWENTSGIDYFSSFDFNHLVFVIHGKSSTYPLSAGLYKIEKSKDVSVRIVDQTPFFKEAVIITEEIPNQLVLNKNYKNKLTVKNMSNGYLKNKILRIEAEDIHPRQKDYLIEFIPPYGETVFSFDFTPKKTNNHSKILFFLDKKAQKIKVVKIKKESFFKKFFFFSRFF